MAITVGPGMQAQLDANGDHAVYGYKASPPEGEHNQDGSAYHWESVWGSKGWYLSSDASGEWENLGPFAGPDQ